MVSFCFCCGFVLYSELLHPLILFIRLLGYHHFGGEPNLSMAVGMPDMGPKEGVPEMARRMMELFRGMVGAYKVGCRFCTGEVGFG